MATTKSKATITVTAEESRIKKFIGDNPVLKASVMCDEVGWSQSSFCQWMADDRPIPKDKLKALKSFLKKYGYK